MRTNLPLDARARALFGPTPTPAPTPLWRRILAPRPRPVVTVIRASEVLSVHWWPGEEPDERKERG